MKLYYYYYCVVWCYLCCVCVSACWNISAFWRKYIILMYKIYTPLDSFFRSAAWSFGHSGPLLTFTTFPQRLRMGENGSKTRVIIRADTLKYKSWCHGREAGAMVLLFIYFIFSKSFLLSLDYDTVIDFCALMCHVQCITLRRLLLFNFWWFPYFIW